jgi:hypothetical protein
MLFGSNDLAAFCMAAVCARPGEIFGHRSHFAKNAWPLNGNEVSSHFTIDVQIADSEALSLG